MSAPTVGLVEWLRPGEARRIEPLLVRMERLGVGELRTGISWADWHTPEGQDWIEELLTRLSARVRVLPCFAWTPPSLGIEPKPSSPPRRPRDFADFIDVMITRFGAHFDQVELWNEPNNLNDWDWMRDADWRIFCEMAGDAAYWARRRGKKVVLGGMCPVDPNWLRLVGDRGVLGCVDAVAVHGFPGTWESCWKGWADPLRRVREVLDRYAPKARIWITEAGYSTWRHDEINQVRAFLDLLSLPVERIYWYSAFDLDPELPTQAGFHVDERHYHFGMHRSDGTPKLLARLLAQGGLPAVRDAVRLAGASGPSARRAVLITGGAGFVGTNLAERLVREGRSVVVYDNLSRPGVEDNARWLRDTCGDAVEIVAGDVRDRWTLRPHVRRASQIYHLAAQVAVTSSLDDPGHDFDVNARGTFTLLELLRGQADPPPLLFTSTNKVYGALDDVALAHDERRYEPLDARLRARGVGEERPLAFHSPYGCSKGAADQYVLDAARTRSLPAAVFRMSCIYGPHQRGTEDQGWVAHFLLRALDGRPVTVYGDGRQVRDVLHVDDLCAAFLFALRRPDALAGAAWNIGGGPSNTLSLLELVDRIEELEGARPALRYAPWRPADQRWFVADTARFGAVASWSPRTDVAQGLRQLHRWFRGRRRLPAEPPVLARRRSS